MYSDSYFFIYIQFIIAEYYDSYFFIYYDSYFFIYYFVLFIIAEYSYYGGKDRVGVGQENLPRWNPQIWRK